MVRFAALPAAAVTAGPTKGDPAAIRDWSAPVVVSLRLDDGSVIEWQPADDDDVRILGPYADVVASQHDG